MKKKYGWRIFAAYFKIVIGVFYKLTEGTNQVISQSKKPRHKTCSWHYLHHRNKRKWLQNAYNLSK